MRIAAFVEGSNACLGGARADPLGRLWADKLVGVLNLLPLDRVVGISKAHVVAMFPAIARLGQRSTTIAESLDAIIARELARRPFECALVAWDLLPPWDRESPTCMWDEARQFFAGLARSPHLPAPWRNSAERRAKDLKSRCRPSARLGVPRPSPNTILTVCMPWMFESLLIHERGVREALGLVGIQIPDWPRRWSRGEREPDKLLQKAILAGQRIRPMPELFRRIRGDMQTAKHEWGAYFVDHAALRRSISQHSIARRLTEVIGAGGSHQAWSLVAGRRDASA